MRPNQTYKLLYSRRNHKQNEKTTYKLGENICKWFKEKRLISKIYKQFMQLKIKKKNPNQKKGRRPK